MHILEEKIILPQKTAVLGVRHPCLAVCDDAGSGANVDADDRDTSERRLAHSQQEALGK